MADIIEKDQTVIDNSSETAYKTIRTYVVEAQHFLLFMLS